MCISVHLLFVLCRMMLTICFLLFNFSQRVITNCFFLSSFLAPHARLFGAELQIAKLSSRPLPRLRGCWGGLALRLLTALALAGSVF